MVAVVAEIMSISSLHGYGAIGLCGSGSVGDDGVVQTPGNHISVIESIALDSSGRYALEGGIL